MIGSSNLFLKIHLYFHKIWPLGSFGVISWVSQNKSVTHPTLLSIAFWSCVITILMLKYWAIKVRISNMIGNAPFVLCDGRFCFCLPQHFYNIRRSEPSSPIQLAVCWKICYLTQFLFSKGWHSVTLGEQNGLLGESPSVFGGL